MADALRAVRRAFDRAAATYDTAAGVQREICAQLARCVDADPPHAPVARVADAGCGTGYGLEHLRARFPDAQCLAVDFAPAMLERARSRHAVLPLCADLQALPLAGASLDALWSSLALQWCAPERALAEFARVLRPEGMAWIATLGPNTLHELRAAFAAVDDTEHVLRFRPAGDWTRIAAESDFEVVAERRGTAFVRAPELRGVIAHLKGIGAHRIDTRPRQPLTRAQWRTLESAYERFRTPDGLLPATYDVILLTLRRRNHGPTHPDSAQSSFLR